MRKYFKVLLSLLFILIAHNSYAQKYSVSTDLLNYARLGTMNVDFSYALSRRWSLTAGVRYNPFTFRKGDPQKQFQDKQQSYSLGLRVWPWHIWSGWWFAGKIRYQEYNTGGIISPVTEEGDRFGAGLYSGYTHMLTSRLNIEFGVGLWGGMAAYRKYECPVCGPVVQEGNKFFIRPDDIIIALVYVF